MPNLVPFKSGEFDQFETGTYSFQISPFEVIGSNGTVPASEVSYFFTGSADYFNQLLTFGVSEVQELVIETQPRPILSLPISRTGFVSPFNPNLVYLYDLRDGYTVSSTNGTRPAPVIFHNQGVFTLDQSVSFEDPGLRRSGLLYPRRKVSYVNRVSSVAITPFGSFNIGGFRAGSQKKFFTDQVYPTNLDSGQIFTQRVFTQPLPKRYSRLFSTGRYVVVGKNPPFETDSLEPDENFSSVSLLLPFDGNDGSIDFIDKSSNSIALSRNGTPTISTVQSKYGGSSMLLPGGSSFLSDNNARIGLSLPGDFTIECDARSTSASDQILCGQDSPLNVQIFRVNYPSPGSIFCFLNGFGIQTGSGLFSINTWNHLALTRSGTTVRLFLNGILRATENISSTIVISKIGSVFGLGMVGNVDNFRVTKGVARYTEDFIPPSEAFFFPPTPAPDPSDINISQITYVQSSVYPGTTPASNSLLTNGSFNDSGVATDSGAGQFVRMDLGSVFQVGSVVIGTATSFIPGGWSKSYTENRVVQHSIDGSSWTQTFNTGTFPVNGIYTFSVDVEARYIRIIDPANSWIAISEFYALSP